MVYLDYNATTPLCPEAREAMLPYLDGSFGNPSSIHAAGRIARAAVDTARDEIAAALGVKSHEIIFTSGGTEANNLAILGLALAQGAEKRHIITCGTEHHAVTHAVDHLETRSGFRVTWLPVDGAGRLDLGQLEAAITPQTALVSIMAANNETGVIHPVEQIAELCRARGVLFHTDLVQAFGKLQVNVRNCDAAAIAAHKFYGPKGAGALYVRAGLTINRLQLGGSQEGDRRAGTENVAAIAGMAAAVKVAQVGLDLEAERQAALRDKLWAGIQKLRPDAICNGLGAPRLANTLNVSFPGADGESLLMNLDLSGVCASSGAACMVGAVLPSHVLLGMGLLPSVALGSVRFSLGRGTEERHVEQALEALRVTLPAQPVNHE